MQVKKRTDYFDNLRGLLIILVLIGHFGGDNTSFSADGNIVLQAIELFIYLFHMPLMFFVSGLFSKNTEKCRNNAFLDLFIPYLLFQVFYAIVQYVNSGTKDYLLNPFYPAPALWYLFALFVFRFVLHDFLKIKWNLIIALIMSVFGICILGLSHEFAMNRIFANLLYFLLGYYCDPELIICLKRKINSKRFRGIVFYLCSFFVSIATFAALCFILKSNKISLANLIGLIGRSKNIADIGLPLIYGPIFSVIGIIAAVIFSVILMACTPERNCFLTVVGQDTLPLYLSHMLVQLIYRDIQRKYFFFDSWTLNYILSFVPITFCVFIFSSKWYRKLFHNLLNGAKRIITIKSN